MNELDVIHSMPREDGFQICLTESTELHERSLRDLLRGKGLSESQRDLLQAIVLRDHEAVESLLIMEFSASMTSFALSLSPVIPSEMSYEIRSILAESFRKNIFRHDAWDIQEALKTFAKQSLTWKSSGREYEFSLRTFNATPRHSVREVRKALDILEEVESIEPLFRQSLPAATKEHPDAAHYKRVYYDYPSEGSLYVIHYIADGEIDYEDPSSLFFATLNHLAPPPRFVRGIRKVLKGVSEIFRSIGRGILGLAKGAYKGVKSFLKGKEAAEKRYGTLGKESGKLVKNLRTIFRSKDESVLTRRDMESMLERNGVPLSALWPHVHELPYLDESLKDDLKNLRRMYYSLPSGDLLT